MEVELEITPISPWYHQVPKIELHLHLEGAIPTEALWQLIQKYGGDPKVPDYESLEKQFDYRDFSHFLETWTWKNGYLREYEDFTLISEAVAQDLASQNIRYAEVFFSPSDFAYHGLETQRLAEAIRNGLECVDGIHVNLVADLVRDSQIDRAVRTLAEVSEVLDFGIIGIGIGGSEQDFPPEPFSDIFAQARNLGLYTSAHAGEAAGADSIWGAIRELKVDRIGHGTRAYEDERLLEYLGEKQIPLEMCPISNVKTAVVDSMDAHPIRNYYERGILVTVNTDDPKMFGNSLADEYIMLETKLGFNRDDIRTLIINAINVSWLPDESKVELASDFYKDPVWND
jgi:adenosine deaminase